MWLHKPAVVLFLLCGYVCALDKFERSLFRTYFGCPTCDESQCSTPRDCELVKEPGICACCYTCARKEGEPCGVFTEKCGAGLQCRPPRGTGEGEEELEALFLGEGSCRGIKGGDKAEVTKFGRHLRRGNSINNAMRSLGDYKRNSNRNQQNKPYFLV